MHVRCISTATTETEAETKGKLGGCVMHLSHARICLAATPQRNDANFVVTTRRCFDDGARGANGELDTAANRKHAGTLTQGPSMLNASTTCAERAPETFPETY